MWLLRFLPTVCWTLVTFSWLETAVSFSALFKLDGSTMCMCCKHALRKVLTQCVNIINFSPKQVPNLLIFFCVFFVIAIFLEAVDSHFHSDFVNALGEIYTW